MLCLTLLVLFVETVVSLYSCSSDTACIFVDNQCPFTLYLQRTTIDGNENFPDSVTNLTKHEQTVLSIEGWRGPIGQRLYAWWQYPIGQEKNWTPSDTLKYRDKVEINWCFTSPNTMCYNPTAVDYFALPVSIGPYNASDCPTVPMTGQYNIDVNNIKSDCPTYFEETPPHGTCLAPRSVCLNNETWNDPLCSSLDPLLQTCVADGNCDEAITTASVYACSDTLAGNPPLCAALNRGVYSVFNTIHDTNTSLFYQTEPYSEYAKYIHLGAPETVNGDRALEYAFPYDDYGAQSSGYEVCTTNFMSVTFCPGSSDTSTTTGAPSPDVTTTESPTKEPTKEPTKGPTVTNNCAGDTDKIYDFKQLVVVSSVSFVSGVVVTVIVMFIYKCCARRRKVLDAQLLGSRLDEPLQA